MTSDIISSNVQEKAENLTYSKLLIVLLTSLAPRAPNILAVFFKKSTQKLYLHEEK